MCSICEGASDDELLFGICGRIQNFGWAIEYVQAPEASESWGYTIGLTEGFGHPELALAGFNGECTAHIINAVGQAISRGAVAVPGALFGCNDNEYLVTEVHPAHYEAGTFGMWWFYYNRLAEGPPGDHRVLEIVPAGRASRFIAEPDEGT